MLQTLNHPNGPREVFVVDLATIPELPITWSTRTEEPYAKALAAAIATGVIEKPGKYAIDVHTPAGRPEVLDYVIYTITE